MFAVCHCPLKVKIQPINLAKTCTTYGLVSEPEVGSCCAARAHYLDLAVTCCVIPVHRESLENWQRRVSAGQWLTSFENCSSRLPKCEGRTVDLAFFFLFIPFDARKQSSNQNDKVRTQREEITAIRLFSFCILVTARLEVQNIKFFEGGQRRKQCWHRGLPVWALFVMFIHHINKNGLLECTASDHDPEIKQCAHIFTTIKAAHWH